MNPEVYECIARSTFTFWRPQMSGPQLWYCTYCKSTFSGERCNHCGAPYESAHVYVDESAARRLGVVTNIG